MKARLKPGTTLQQARSELAVLAQDFEREYPQLNRDRGAAVRTQFEMRTRDDDRELEVQRDLRRSSRWPCCWWRAPTSRGCC